LEELLQELDELLQLDELLEDEEDVMEEAEECLITYSLICFPNILCLVLI
jgi:hypothetical protein